MKFLVVNDDGFEGIGLHILIKYLNKYGSCYVVVPNKERSCSSQAISLRSEIKIEEILIEGTVKSYKIDGLPCDCTRLGLYLFKDIDIVISGVNNGSNLGTDILYSGTVGAAMEGNILNKKSIAISTDHFHFQIVEKELDNLLKYLLVEKFELLSKEYTLNVNFPNKNFNNSKGIKYTFMGKRYFSCYFDELKNNVFYPQGELLNNIKEDEGSDCFHHDLGYITITPVGLDCTKKNVLKDWVKFN